MTLTVTKISGTPGTNTVGVYAHLTPTEKPVLLHRVLIQLLDKAGNMFGSNAFYPNQFLDPNINILVASLEISDTRAAQVRASANFEIISDAATSPVLPL